MFDHDIALSFAGEQRAQVEKIAECLKSAGARVFYDKYSKAELWGKDLYQHISQRSQLTELSRRPICLRIPSGSFPLPGTPRSKCRRLARKRHPRAVGSASAKTSHRDTTTVQQLPQGGSYDGWHSLTYRSLSTNFSRRFRWVGLRIPLRDLQVSKASDADDGVSIFCSIIP
jgi:hypothetical protein